MINKSFALISLIAASTTAWALSKPIPPAIQEDLVSQSPWIALDPSWGVWQFEFMADGTGKCSWTRPDMPVYTYEITHTRLNESEIRFICIPVYSTHGASNFVGWTTKQRLIIKSVTDKKEFPVIPKKLFHEHMDRIESQKAESKK
jgi:hypothetical protein